MSSLNRQVILDLENNPLDQYTDGVLIILRLLENVIREPDNAKYRTVRMENKVIKEKVLCLINVMPVLQCLGFEKIGQELKLSSTMLIADLKKYRDFLKERLEIYKNPKENIKPKNEELKTVEDANMLPSTSQLPQKVDLTSPNKTGAIRKRPRTGPIKPFSERITFPRTINLINSFLQHLESMSDQVMQYEDDNLKAIGRSLIPIETLTENSLKKLRHVQKLIKSGKQVEDDPCFSDFLLVELVNWFNTEFFTWINSMPCKKCGNENVETKGGYVDQGVRVETFTCCNETVRFYRYNDIETILKTRKGRCGEYANCFTFLCRCLGYDARLIYATFDHVWTEVYSIAQKRWIHIDPSDNVIDAPLMYQHGWKRNIDYVIGFSRDDVQDVTWRYTNNHEEVKLKRHSCREKELLQTIITLRQKRQANCTATRRKYLCKRDLFEIVEFMTEKPVTENERKGRSSGSLDWKRSRGEQDMNNFYVFNALNEEIEKKQFNLRYSCAKNTYERFVENNNSIKILETTDTWESYHYVSSNIFRKVERDWKMVYLARVEDSHHASISWNFDFKNLKIKSIGIKFEMKTYENGIIKLQFIDCDGKHHDIIDALNGISKFEIKVTMSGGKGDVAWQHTQLFRQRTGSTDYPFELRIRFH